MSKNTAVIEKLWEEISQIDGNKNPQLKDWHKNYFIEHKNRYLKDLELIKKVYKGGNMVEIGSLPCQLTFCLKELNYPIIGFDLNPTRAESFIKRHKLEIKKCDIENESLPLKDGSADLIIFNETFEHLRINPLYTLKELKRILSKNGRMILSTPNLYSLRNIVNFNLGKSFNDAFEEFQKLETVGHMGHIREYSFKEMKKFLGAAGFEIIEHHYEIYKKSKKPFIGMIINLMNKILKKIRPFQVFILKKQPSN